MTPIVVASDLAACHHAEQNEYPANSARAMRLGRTASAGLRVPAFGATRLPRLHAHGTRFGTHPLDTDRRVCTVSPAPWSRQDDRGAGVDDVMDQLSWRAREGARRAAEGRRQCVAARRYMDCRRRGDGWSLVVWLERA